jgi:hypothetical protein
MGKSYRKEMGKNTKTPDFSGASTTKSWKKKKITG